MLADRARLAMGIASGARTIPRTAVASSPTLLNDSQSSTPGVTAAPWGGGVLTGARSAPPWRLPLAIAVVVAGAVGAFMLFPRGTSSARPEASVAAHADAPSVAAAPPPAVTALPPPQVADPVASIAAPEPTPQAAPVATPHSAPSPVPTTHAPVSVTPPVVRPNPAPAHSATGKPSAPDDDIPTIR